MSTVSDTSDTGHTSPTPPAVPSRGGVRASLRTVRRRWNEAELFSAPRRSEWPVALRRVRTIGFVLLGLQLLVLGWWSWVMTHRFALTWDYTAYEQAAWLIGHGHPDPYSSVLGKLFWRNDSELIMWPLAALVRISPALVTLPWVQDASIVAGEGIALAWMCDVIAARHDSGRQSKSMSVALAALAVVLLVGNPWSAWAASYDFHLEGLVTLFALGAARDLHRGRRTVWVWVGFGLLCGAVGVSYMGAVGVSAALSGRVRLRRGAGIALLGFGLLGVLQMVGGVNKVALLEFRPIVSGKPFNVPVPHISAEKIVKAAIEHPGRIVDALWRNRANIWGNLSPGGILGLFWVPLAAPIWLITTEGGLGSGGFNFSLPGFQNVALPVMVTVGTIALLATTAARPAWRSGRRKWVVPSLIAALTLNSVAWAIVWLPEVSHNWLSVTPGAARVIKKLQRQIAPGDEVAASQGFSGAFARREWVYSMQGANVRIPVHARKVWIIISPAQGIENPNVSGEYADISQLSTDPQMHLVTDSNGIWAFEWSPPKGTKRLILKGPPQGAVPSWALAGVAGSPVRIGPASRWYTTSNGKRGYVVDHSYWRENRGVYRARVTLSATKLVDVELWDSTTSTLLARNVVTNSHGKLTVTLIGHLRSVPKQPVIAGWSLWGISTTSPPGNSLEVRVWTPGGNDHVNVYRVSVAPLSSVTHTSAHTSRFHRRRT